jgi:hypothetical protein
MIYYLSKIIRFPIEEKKNESKSNFVLDKVKRLQIEWFFFRSFLFRILD